MEISDCDISKMLCTLWYMPSTTEYIDVLLRPHFYQTRSAWSMDQGSNKNHSPAYHFAPTVTKFCVMWEGSSLPHDTKFGNCRCKIVDSRAFPSWSLIHGLRWFGLIKAEQGWASSILNRSYTSLYFDSFNTTKYDKLCVCFYLDFPFTCPYVNRHYENNYRTTFRMIHGTWRWFI